MKRNFLLSCELEPKDALLVVRGLLTSNESRNYGISGGIGYLLGKRKQFGRDSSIDAMSNMVIRAANRQVGEFLRGSVYRKKIHSIASQLKLLLDLYKDKAGHFGEDYVDIRCECLFNLATILREEGNLPDAIELLQEIESHCGYETSCGDLPSMISHESLQICLAEALLLNGKTEDAFEKSKMVTSLFDGIREKTMLLPVQWATFSYALLILLRASVRLSRFEDVFSIVKTASVFEGLETRGFWTMRNVERIHEEASHLRPQFAWKDRKDNLTSEIKREFTHRGDPLRPFSASASASEYSMSRRRALSVESRQWEIEPPSHNTCHVQTGELQDGDAAEVFRMSSSLPPASRENDQERTNPQFVQSPRAGQRLRHESAWRICHSKRSGREYYYNVKTGISTWHRPDTEIDFPLFTVAR